MRKTVADGPGVSSQVVRIRRLEEGGGLWGKVRSLCPRISSTRFQRSIVNRISRYVAEEKTWSVSGDKTN